MAIPDFQTMMLPALTLFRNGHERSVREVVEILADNYRLKEEELKELYPASGGRVFHNRVAWTIVYLKRAGLVESPKRGHYKITSMGKEVLKDNHKRIDVKLLKRLNEDAFKQTKRKVGYKKVENELSTPQESIEEGYTKLRQELGSELLEAIKAVPPDFFEKMVVELLVVMGYGGSKIEAGKATRLTKDGGIDGIINEDKLGLDNIYIQAKRWADTTVGSPEVQKFAGALQGYRAKKGIFITTSCFSKDAVEYASKIDNKIVLIDGERLTQLMMDHNIGVSIIDKFEIKKIDSDYFSET